jgi:hypothetical protein
MEKNEDQYQYYLVQNKGYDFGDTMTNPIIMVCTNHYGGFKGTLKTFIQDVIYDLIPEDGYEND